MDSRQERLIIDNPNLQTNVLARLLGVDKATIRKFRGNRGVHIFKGHGIPYMTSEIYNGGFRYVTVYQGRKLGVGSFRYCIEQLDRLLFCLDSNNGKLPRTLNQCTFDDLRFIKELEG